jgi:hypothetical protein
VGTRYRHFSLEVVVSVEKVIARKDFSNSLSLLNIYSSTRASAIYEGVKVGSKIEKLLER